MMNLVYIEDNKRMMGLPIFNAVNALFVGTYARYEGVYHENIMDAVAEAVSGNTIIVSPRNYDENVVVPDGVNIYFMPGAEINSTTTSSPALTVGTGRIFGFLKVSSTRTSGPVVRFDNAQTNAIIDTITAQAGAYALEIINNSDVILTVNQIIGGQVRVNGSSLNIDAKECYGFKLESGSNLTADVVELTGDNVYDAGTSYLKVEVASKIDSTIFTVNGGEHTIKNMVAMGYTSDENMIDMTDIADTELRLINCRLQILNGLGHLIILIQNSAPPFYQELILESCVLLTTSANPRKNINSGIPKSIKTYNCFSNNIFGTNAHDSIGLFTVHADVI